jgi:hypothetical protein
MKQGLSESELEQAYDLIAAAIDRAGPAHESLFLAKLCLALGAQMASIDAILTAIRAAEEDLRDPTPP